MTAEERAVLDEKSARAGMTAAAFLRAAALGDAGPRARRRPPVEHVVLRELVGHCGRIGNNLNQIARALNMDKNPDAALLRQSLRALLEVRSAIYLALGMKIPEGPGAADPPS